MHFRNDISALNARLIAADPEDSGDFELAFAEPDSADDIARFEALAGVALPAQLKALYLEGGAFTHVHYPHAWQTICIDTVKQQLELLTRPENQGRIHPPALGLVAAIHNFWGERQELIDSLDAACEHVVNANYFVFGTRYIDDNVIDYLYFDRNGLFGNFRFDQDEAAHNINRIEHLADIIPEGDLNAEARRAHVLAEAAVYSSPDTYPGLSLKQLLDAQFGAIMEHLAQL